MHIHKQHAYPTKIATGQIDTVQKTEQETAKNQNSADYRLSEKELDNISGRETKEKAEKEASSDMPDHIAKMIEQLKKIKEQIEQQKEQLVKLKALNNQQDEAVKAQVEAQTNMIVSMQAQMGSLVQTIAEAMKEAGITDTSVLVNAMV